jgi:hypothetical protein
MNQTVWNSWLLGLKHIREVFDYPFGSLPRIRGLYYFEDDKQFYLVNKLVTLIYYYSLVFSPSVVIVTWGYVVNFMKLISGYLSLLHVRLLRELIVINSKGISHIYLTITVILVFVECSWFLIILFTVCCSAINNYLVSDNFNFVLKEHIYRRKVFGPRGRNIIVDETSAYYNPLDPVSSLIGKFEREINTSETIPALSEMVDLLRKQRLVRSWRKDRFESMKRIRMERLKKFERQRDEYVSHIRKNYTFSEIQGMTIKDAMMYKRIVKTNKSNIK